ncbi:MAG: tryptophan--tRNA ligase [bacterium]
MVSVKKLRVLSGIQPTGSLHIGNYLGALKQWIPLQNEHECFFMIVDLHAITANNDHPVEMQGRIYSAALDYLAAGLDPKKATIFVQSHLPEHCELNWLLSTVTPFGELQRMTQWKDKANINKVTNFSILDIKKKAKSLRNTDDQLEYVVQGVLDGVNRFQKEFNEVNTGLLIYPVLMASDILLYKTNLVPVGEDQQQHVELTRIIARKFNTKYGKIFIEPKTQLTQAKRIMSLADPTKKMSKSLGPKNYISLSDLPEVIEDKVSKAVTEMGGGNKNEMSPGVQNLLLLLNEFGQPKLVKRYSEQYKTGKIRYLDLKNDLAEAIIKGLKPFHDRREKLAKDKKAVWKVLNDGAEKARPIAQKTLREVKERMGLV